MHFLLNNLTVLMIFGKNHQKQLGCSEGNALCSSGPQGKPKKLPLGANPTISIILVVFFCAELTKESWLAVLCLYQR